MDWLDWLDWGKHDGCGQTASIIDAHFSIQDGRWGDVRSADDAMAAQSGWLALERKGKLVETIVQSCPTLFLLHFHHPIAVKMPLAASFLPSVAQSERTERRAIIMPLHLRCSTSLPYHSSIPEHITGQKDQDQDRGRDRGKGQRCTVPAMEPSCSSLMHCVSVCVCPSCPYSVHVI